MKRKIVIEIQDFELVEMNGKEYYVLNTNLGDFTPEEFAETLKELLSEGLNIKGKIILEID